MLNHFRIIAAGIALPLILGGCATEYSCPIPQGDGGCRSVAQVYEDTLDDSGSITPSAGASKGTDHSSTASSSIPAPVTATATPVLKPAAAGDAVLSTPRVLRILFSPWPDSDHDLEGGGYVYLRLDGGQWTIAPQQ
jgi:conjugal transfer pilus assembly protein TraV